MVETCATRRVRVGAACAAGLTAIVLAACSGGAAPHRAARIIEPRASSPPPQPAPNAQPGVRSSSRYKIGAPYRIGGRWYVPAEDPNYNRSGLASWYGNDFHGKKTANGETYDMNALTAAHPTLPLPSLVYVTNLANGRTVLVRVNDRGPYAQGRIIDLSRSAARMLGTEGQGLGHVRVRYAGRAPLDGNDQAERQFLAGRPWQGGVGGRMSLGAAE